MSADERTAMLTPGPATGPTRRINGRHAPAAAESYYDDDEEPRRGAGRIIGITVAVLVALGLVGFVGYQVLSGPPAPTRVAVPALLGTTEQDARNQLDAAQLRVGEVQQVESKVEDIGKVTATDPAPGVQVNERTAVTLSVGKGPAEVTVPKLVGLDAGEATAQLTSVGLKIGTQTEQDTGDANQVGKVIASDPDPGTRVDGASAVNIVIGRAQTTVAVPDVRNQDADRAQQTLEDAGFRVQQQEIDGGGDDGSVIGTNPPAGSQLKRGSEVELQISSGKNGQGQVPDVVGLDLNDAQRQLGNAGFNRVDVQRVQVQQAGADDQVLQQAPGGGQVADTDDTVQLLVADAQSG